MCCMFDATYCSFSWSECGKILFSYLCIMELLLGEHLMLCTYKWKNWLLTLRVHVWLWKERTEYADWDDEAAQYKVCFTLPLSPAVQSRSLRSVMEVYSIQPGYSVNRDVGVSSSPHGKLRLRPEYADMDPLHHNNSYRDGEHHHRDPITGHAATLRWITHHENERKWCHGLAHFVSDVWPRHRCSFRPLTGSYCLIDMQSSQPLFVLLVRGI